MRNVNYVLYYNKQIFYNYPQHKDYKYLQNICSSDLSNLNISSYKNSEKHHKKLSLSFIYNEKNITTNNDNKLENNKLENNKLKNNTTEQFHHGNNIEKILPMTKKSNKK